MTTAEKLEGYLLAATPGLVLLIAPLPGGRWLLPLAAPLTLYRAFARRVGEKEYFAAWRLGLLWAALLSLGVIALVYALPDAALRGILHGEAYRSEMFRWVATGDAAENDWRVFLPRQLLHLAIFALLTWLSGGYAGLVMGSALVGYMSYFVASYALASGHPVLGLWAAWVPWSVVRVMAFVLLGAVLSRALLVRRAWPFAATEYALLAWVGGGIVADLMIKAFLAPEYGLFLRSLVAGGGAGVG